MLPGLQTTAAEFEPLLSLRSMGGYMLVHVFPGPTPRAVVEQISAHLGRLEKMPPLWATGYHVCRCEPLSQSTIFIIGLR